MGQLSERPVNIDVGTGYELPEPESAPDLVEVERGTPAGELLRRYWHPFAIRCCYHGWLFDIEGNTLEMPCEPDRGQHLDRYRQPWYPLVDYHGMLFTYMGPPQLKPAFPTYDILSEVDEETDRDQDLHHPQAPPRHPCPARLLRRQAMGGSDGGGAPADAR